MPDAGHIALLTLRQQRLVVLEQYRVLAEPKLLNKRFYVVPHRDRIASDRWQDIVLANQIVTHQVADPIVIAAHAMNRALRMLSSAQCAKVFPRRSRKFVQQKKLIVLEFGTLPDFEQMRRDRKITLARGLTELQHHYDGTRGECDGRDHRRDRGGHLPIYRRHPVGTLATLTTKTQRSPERAAESRPDKLASATPQSRVFQRMVERLIQASYLREDISQTGESWAIGAISSRATCSPAAQQWRAIDAFR